MPGDDSLRIVNANLYTLQVGPDPSGRLPEGAVVVRGGEIVWVGPSPAAPPAARTIDANGRAVTPGWIDAHSHFVFGGDRTLDYRRRAEGRTYREIAAAGGGILSTVRATRGASEDALVEGALPRMQRWLARGVTTVEGKSGYGLTTADELKILRAMRRVAAAQPIEVESTFLGAHAVPPEHKAAPGAYVDLVVEEMIPAVAEAKLARFCDVFVEEGFFDLAQGRRVLEAAAARGLRPKLHADQLTAGGGAELAAELGAVSADHLEHAGDAALAKLAAAGTVAVLLPGAALFLGQGPTRVERFRAAGVRMALATDQNPGTCPTDDLALMGTLACSQMGMTVDEALRAVTVDAAAAIGRPDLGVIAPRRPADLVMWDAAAIEHLFWHFGHPHAALVVKKGTVVLERDAAPDCRPDGFDG